MLQSISARLVGVVLIFCLLGPNWVHCQEDADEAFLRDVLLTREVRMALLKDPQLGPLNLGVRVQNRIAILWGPVPSAELERRAVLCARQQDGLRGVIDRLSLVLEEGSRFSVPAVPMYLPPIR